jgi:nucleotide-binding universal stress UspA family protein
MSWVPRQLVIVPVDLSSASLRAVDTARQLVDGPEHIRIIHVLPVLAAAEPGVIWDTVDDSSRSEHAAQAVRERLLEAGYEGLDVSVVVGDPGHEIADFAKQIGADLIVLPSHGRTGLTRLLIGSVAERVVRLAQCPVLVLRE